MNIEIKFPTKLTIYTLKEVLCQNFFDQAYDEIIIDLSNVDFIKPVGIAYTIAIIKYSMFKKIGKNYKIVKPNNKNVHNYLTRMNFYEMLNVNVQYPFIKHDSNGRFCEIKEVSNSNDVDIINKHIEEIIMQNIKEEYKLRNCISYSISEVIENIFHHSESPVNGFVCAQVYPQQKEFEIGIVDCGIGIKNSLSKKYNDIENCIQAIEKALELNVTCKVDRSNAGEGLYFTKKFIEENGGELAIYSGNGEYIYNNGLTRKSMDDNYYQGTIVHMKFDLNKYVDIKSIFDREIPLSKYDFDDMF
ncbi:ATP-binding protein [Thermoanaerobacterium thermosaccharolyticum]|uniref:ATP-binding protein n=1 Tax=Thermoanaerobacterium thermosaccharolyticum TaxID=1517 RepID=UPI003D28D385